MPSASSLRAASRIERVGGSIQCRTMFADEVFPRRLVACRTAAGEREVLEMQRVELRAAFGASLQRFSKPLERHTPPLGACPAIKALDERRVDRQSSHSTPCALIGDDGQQHADGQRKHRASDLAAYRGDDCRAGHDHDQSAWRPAASDAVGCAAPTEESGRSAPQTSATPMKRRNGPGSAIGPCCMASTGRTSFMPPANDEQCRQQPLDGPQQSVGSHRDISFCSLVERPASISTGPTLRSARATGRRDRCRFRPDAVRLAGEGR